MPIHNQGPEDINDDNCAHQLTQSLLAVVVKILRTPIVSRENCSIKFKYQLLQYLKIRKCPQ